MSHHVDLTHMIFLATSGLARFSTNTAASEIATVKNIEPTANPTVEYC
jgi:hypothetical protein